MTFVILKTLILKIFKNNISSPSIAPDKDLCMAFEGKSNQLLPRKIKIWV